MTWMVLDSILRSRIRAIVWTGWMAFVYWVVSINIQELIEMVRWLLFKRVSLFWEINFGIYLCRSEGTSCPQYTLKCFRNKCWRLCKWVSGWREREVGVFCTIHAAFHELEIIFKWIFFLSLWSLRKDQETVLNWRRWRDMAVKYNEWSWVESFSYKGSHWDSW